MVLAIVIVAFGVGLDNLGVAISLGTTGHARQLRAQVAVIFGLFEALMPVLGVLLGHGVASSLGTKAPIIGGVLLGLVGAYSIATALVRKHESRQPPEPPGALRLLILGAALSIDNLVVGFAIGSHAVNLHVAVVVIAVVSVGLSLLGLELGDRFGTRLGDRSELVGGVLLVAVGVAIGTNLL